MAYTTKRSFKESDDELLDITRSSQPKPYLLAAPYNIRKNVISNKFGSMGGRNAGNMPSILDICEVERSHVYNKAYDRFVAKLGDSSSFGATLTAERRETYGMIRGFVVRAYLSARAAKRGDFLGVLHELGFNPPRKRVVRTYSRVTKSGRRKFRRTENVYYKMPDGRLIQKTAANSWLLWSYGISPLLGDIQNATEVFIRAVPDGVPVHSGAASPFKMKKRTDGYYTFTEWSYEGSIKVGIDAYVVCENYDLWLLNQLGLVNPLQWVNEAVPFSFVVDWASNWSSVINSLTDFVGLNFTRSSNSTKILVNTSFNYQYLPWYSKQVLNRFNCEQTQFVRKLGIQRPQLRFRYERFEWQRALNAISLLVGFLPKSHKN